MQEKNDSNNLQDYNTNEVKKIICDVLKSKKYRHLSIPQETILDLIIKEQPKWRSKKEAKKAVRQKLHNIVAVYLGDPDYPAASTHLKEVFLDNNEQSIRNLCMDILETHASTRERIPIMEKFYNRIFSEIGKPEIILDLACGLHPFSFPWMGLPKTTRYFAYDLHLPRINLINQFFYLSGLDPLAVHQDILVEPPLIEADAAFLFKEAHRMEKRQIGCSRSFWQQLHVRNLLVSLPVSNLTGDHSLEDKHRKLVYDTIDGLNWKITEIKLENELVFCLDTGYEPKKEKAKPTN
ncbi:MAG: hypothetical protein JEZ06_02600 [Anaerolineaceae bacterium]|nr:hypothetical protein [Anaerolineaceae bacterium]